MTRVILIAILSSVFALAEVNLGTDVADTASALKYGFEALLLSAVIAAPAVAIASGMALLRFNKEAKSYFQNELAKADEAYRDFLEEECVTVSYDRESMRLLKEIEELENQLRSLS